MKYKMIAVDMDGTLLNSDGKISVGNAKAVRAAVDHGIIFVLATGRPIQGVRKYADSLGLDGAAITYNGAVCVDLATDGIIYEQGMDKDDAALAIELGQEYDTTMCIWSRGQLYVSKLNDRAYDYMKISGVEPILVEDYGKLIGQGITKILWYDDVDMIGRMPAEMAKHPFRETSFCLSRPFFIEFFSSKVSKAAAIDRLCRHYGISREEVIAMGDAPNDLPMIEYAGLGVAMGNADDCVKAAAKFVTSTNDEDGVAAVIEKFILDGI